MSFLRLSSPRIQNPLATPPGSTVTTTQILTGLARITATTLQTLLGKSRLTATAAQTLLGKARVTAIVLQTLLGKARITATTTQTLTGKGDVRNTTTQTLTGKARITITTLQTLLGKARVTTTALQTLLGKARITATTLKTLTGLARITATTLQTLTGKARITATTQQTLTGKARITATTTQTLTGKGDIAKTTTQTLLGKAKIASSLDGTDYSTNTNDLTNVGPADSTASTPFTVSTHVASFVSASSQYLYAPDHASLQTSTDVSLEAWIKPTTLTGNHTIAMKGRDAGDNTENYGYRVNSAGKVEFNYFGTLYHTWTTTAAQVSTGVWAHIAFTYTFGTASSIQCYINGVPVAGSWTQNDGTEAVAASATRLQIGAIHTVSGGPFEIFNGLMDELRFWSVIRSAAQIANNYQTELTGNESGLMAYYPWESTIAVTATQTLTGLARVTGVATQTLTGKARVTATTTQTLLGHANIRNTTTRTLTGVARVTATTLQTILGKARLTATALQTLLGKARVTATTVQTLSGKGDVAKNTTQTIQGVANISPATITTTKTLTGKARVTASTKRTLTGKASITSNIAPPLPKFIFVDGKLAMNIANVPANAPKDFYIKV